MPTLEALEKGPIQELGSVKDLEEWLVGRVGDDNDVVIDDLQEEFANIMEQEDEAEGIKGLSDWSSNCKAIEAYQGKPAKLGEDWEFDGFKRCRYYGKRDADGNIVGIGSLLYENKDTFQGVFKDGIMNREGVLTRATDGGTKLEGEWVDGLLQGEVKQTLQNTGWIEGYYKNGVRHGYFRKFGPRYNGKHILRSMGRYYKGVKRGNSWRGFYDHSGWLFGCMDSSGSLTGDNMAYIYPDFKMAIKGKFKDGLLVEGYQCQPTGCYEDRGIMVPVFSKTFGPAYEYEQGTIKNIALHPLLRDPWEDTKVCVGQSNLPQGGEGLFAKKAIGLKEILAIYNGIKIKTSTYASEHMPRSDYRIRLNGDMDMDIPNGFQSTDQYCATLAHKANHSFSPNCEWTLFESPRFGLVRSLTAQKPIEVGEEILVNYQMTIAKSPDWYRVVWLQHMRKVKKNDDTAIQRFIDRQYELQGFRIPLPESEELKVPTPIGVDLSGMPEEYLTPEQQSEEAAIKFSRSLAGLRPGEKVPEEDEPRFQEITEVD